ncbi:MAG: FAD-binding oxidoreductase, partial [Geminicoccaceae bacterium]|nr:FAD-binding oxidoreductase [Geminicoccaceae bacterium]
MKTHARVVIIGGGIAGCSTLYHLTQEGWTDAVLVERDELTSGTTWHSATQVTQFGAIQVMVGLKRHSVRLYRELAADPEHPIDYHITGGVRLAHDQDHLDGYRHFIAMAQTMGVELELIDAEETVRRHPLIRGDGLQGSLFDPLDGDIDPSQLTQALARRARQAGAEIQRFNPVLGIERTRSGEWRIRTKNGDIVCESFVNAGGYRVNEIGRMYGFEHPVVSMEHQYLLTEPIPYLNARLKEDGWRVPIIRDPGDDFYARQEKDGLLVGIYEQDCRTWGLAGIAPDFTMALCPNDMDRLLDNLEAVFGRLPALEETG